MPYNDSFHLKTMHFGLKMMLFSKKSVIVIYTYTLKWRKPLIISMITQILYTPLYTLYIHYIYTSVYTCFLPAEGYLESWRGGLWEIVGYYWGIVVYYWELVGYYLWRGASPLET